MKIMIDWDYRTGISAPVPMAPYGLMRKLKTLRGRVGRVGSVAPARCSTDSICKEYSVLFYCLMNHFDLLWTH